MANYPIEAIIKTAGIGKKDEFLDVKAVRSLLSGIDQSIPQSPNHQITKSKI